MHAAASSLDWPAWAGVALGVGGAAIGVLTRIVQLVTRIASSVEEHTRVIDKNARHLDALMEQWGNANIRISTMEEYLERDDGTSYHPPVIMSRGREQ